MFRFFSSPIAVIRKGCVGSKNTCQGAITSRKTAAQAGGKEGRFGDRGISRGPKRCQNMFRLYVFTISMNPEYWKPHWTMPDAIAFSSFIR